MTSREEVGGDSNVLPFLILYVQSTSALYSTRVRTVSKLTSVNVDCQLLLGAAVNKLTLSLTSTLFILNH